jgi:hypothetical protein
MRISKKRYIKKKAKWLMIKNQIEWKELLLPKRFYKKKMAEPNWEPLVVPFTGIIYIVYLVVSLIMKTNN